MDSTEDVARGNMMEELERVCGEKGVRVRNCDDLFQGIILYPDSKALSFCGNPNKEDFRNATDYIKANL